MTDDKGNLRGSNFYNYSPNVQPWVDLYGLSSGCNDGDEKDSKLINQKKLKRILDKIDELFNQLDKITLNIV